MSRVTDPGYTGGAQGHERVEDHASCTVYFSLNPHYATKGINFYLRSVHYMHSYPFPVI